MKSSDNKQFWNRVSYRYDFIIRKDAKAHEMMYSYMADDLKSVIATDFSPEMVAEARKSFCLIHRNQLVTNFVTN